MSRYSGGCDLLRTFLGRYALGPRHKVQIFRRRHVHVHGWLLRQVSNEPLGLHGFFRNAVPVNEHLALRGAQATGDDVHGCAFACAIGSQKAVDFSFVNGEIQIGDVVPIALG